MSECQKEVAFLRRIFLYDDTTERHNLEEQLRQAERVERCLQRAVWLMAVLTLLAMVGIGYSAVLGGGSPADPLPLASRIFCILGLGSVICLGVFATIWMMARSQFNKCRERCRGLVTNFLECKLGKPPVLIPSGLGQGRQEILTAV